MTPLESPEVVARPARGTPRFRRNCWVAVVDGALVANDRKNRRHRFQLDGGDHAPRSQFMLIRSSGPWEHHFLDGRGESIVSIPNSLQWDVEPAVGQAAGLDLQNGEIAPPLRADCVKLEDASWAEMHYVTLALAALTVLVTLGRLQVIGVFPWVFVALGLIGYTLAALLGGTYFGPPSKILKGRRAPSRPGNRNERKRRKRRLRRGG